LNIPLLTEKGHLASPIILFLFIQHTVKTHFSEASCVNLIKSNLKGVGTELDRKCEEENRNKHDEIEIQPWL
jgi:hypothetical protein